MAAAGLRSMPGVEVFFPRLRSARRTGKRANPALEPLFPCYLFARFPLVPLLEQVRHVRGVKAVVGFGDHWPTIAEAEIEELRREFGADEVMDRPSPHLQPGTELEVVSGPFRGFRAVVKFDLPSAQRVQVLIEVLRRSATVEMSHADLGLAPGVPDSLRA